MRGFLIGEGRAGTGLPQSQGAKQLRQVTIGDGSLISSRIDMDPSASL